MPSARLAELLWAGEGGERVPATLRSHVAHLRKALAGGADADVTRGPSPWLVTDRLADGAAYALRIEPERVDAARFEGLVSGGRSRMAEGHWESAALTLSQALALWRGQPFAEVADRPFATSAVRRLEALHRAAWSARIEADMRLGRHREVVGELEAMMATWPDDEGLRRMLAVSLARSGRMAEAARVCQDGIRLAVSQGLDPSDLTQLQRDLLGSPSLPHGRPRARGLAAGLA